MQPVQPQEEESLWIYPPVDSAWNYSIINELNIHPVTAQVLVSRGFMNFDQIHGYLYAKLPNLIDPNLLPDMGKAVERVLAARKNGESVLIYGDNDVDGITGATLLTEFLNYVGCHALAYIPNRTSLNQSLMLDALEYAEKNRCRLLITVDCGITAAEEIQCAVEKGVDVIVTDHHEPTDQLPHCVATLNPKLKGSTYPNRDLTGVGVAFKLAHGITNTLITSGEMSPSKIDLKRYLDLVALGTVADMGSLLGENRILVRYGLRQMHLGKRIGLTKLLGVCEVNPSEISPPIIASKVAPRLNSLGRIADPNKGVELLLIQDPFDAGILANELDLNNIERQRIERKDSEDVEQYISKHPEIFNHRAILLYSDKWHPGIIPIIAARIAKQYNRPTVIIAVDKGLGKGSIRTIPEFPILPILRENAKLLENFGGHDYAAGLTIKYENIEAFKNRFIAAADNRLGDQDIQSKLQLDAKIDFSELTFDFMESLNLLEPFGNENPPPVFYADARQAWPPKIVGKTHLKFYLEQKDRMLEGIGFNMAKRRPNLLRKNLLLRVAFSPQINTFLNKASIQLQVRDFKILED
jgi:single-stranded-DNA-specific exonuclease